MGSSPRREMKSRASERLPWKLIIKRLRVRFSVFTAAVPASGTAAVVIAVIPAVIVGNYAARVAILVLVPPVSVFHSSLHSGLRRPYHHRSSPEA